MSRRVFRCPGRAVTLAAFGVLWILLSGSAWLPHWHAGGPAKPQTSRAVDAEAAVARSLDALLTDGTAWLEGRTLVQSGNDGCVSCHQVPYGVWGLYEARRSGIEPDWMQTTQLTLEALEFLARPGKARAMSWSPMLLATADRQSAEGRREFKDFILGAQTREGFWEARGQFPGQRRELRETNAIATMWTMLALAAAGDGGEPEAASVERAVAWLDRSGPGESTEWLLLAALIEESRGGGARGRTLVDELAARQNPDGGWGWAAGEESNAYSTGQVLYALAEVDARRTADGQADARAAAYLVDRQGDDGFWTVSSTLTSRDPSQDKDYVYKYWGTAWATVGLARHLRPNEPESEPG